MTAGKLIRVGMAAGSLALATPPTAGAAVTIGQSPPVAGTPQTGAGCSAPFDIDGVQASSTTGNSYAVPAGGGVITSWSTFTPNGSGMLRFRVYVLGTGGMTPVGESQVETVTPSSPPAFPTRIPVSGGERIGYTVFTGAQLDNCVYANTGNEGDFTRGSQGAAPIGQFEPFFADPQPQALANLSAQLEPDADRDGFGDETQDGCPTDASTQAACTPAPSARCDGRKATIVGTDAAEKLRGTFGKDVIYAGGGDDAVVGAGGDDVICGGGGADLLRGNAGKDRLVGGGGKDKLVGGGAKDTCEGGPGKDLGKSCEKGPDA
jgi:hypothetical protein